METNGHPDLIRLGRSLRERMDRTLEAEMEAARSAALRTRTMRDLLLDAEDRRSFVRVTSSGGDVHAGTVIAVGADHVEIGHPDGSVVVAVCHVVAIEETR